MGTTRSQLANRPFIGGWGSPLLMYIRGGSTPFLCLKLYAPVATVRLNYRDLIVSIAPENARKPLPQNAIREPKSGKALTAHKPHVSKWADTFNWETYLLLERAGALLVEQQPSTTTTLTTGMPCGSNPSVNPAISQYIRGVGVMPAPISSVWYCLSWRWYV